MTRAQGENREFSLNQSMATLKLLLAEKVLVNKILLLRTFLATEFLGQEPGNLTWWSVSFWKSYLVTGPKNCYLENSGT